MNGLIESLTKVLKYLGRGAMPVDGIYWRERVAPAASVCAATCNGAPTTGAGMHTARGYRVLM